MIVVMLLEPAQQRKVILPLSKNSSGQGKAVREGSCWLAGELLTKVLFLALCEEGKRNVHEKKTIFVDNFMYYSLSQHANGWQTTSNGAHPTPPGHQAHASPAH